MLSGSRYHLAQKCLYPFRPDVTCPERPSGEAARIGTAAHSLVEAHFNGRKAKSDRDLEAFPIARQAIGWLENVEVPTAVEVAIVYNALTDTAREVTGAGHRDYGTLAPGEIPTTLDLVWVEDDAVVVNDLKTGSKTHAHVEQLEIQSLAASRLYKRPRARHAFLWARKTKAERDPLVEMSEGDLEMESWRAASLVRRLPMARPETGDHCWFCPLGKENCPAYSREATSLPLAGE